MKLLCLQSCLQIFSFLVYTATMQIYVFMDTDCKPAVMLLYSLCPLFPAELQVEGKEVDDRVIHDQTTQGLYAISKERFT